MSVIITILIYRKLDQAVDEQEMMDQAAREKEEKMKLMDNEDAMIKD